MNLPKTGVILLAFMLAAMAMIPMVSGDSNSTGVFLKNVSNTSSSRDIIEQNYVTEQLAYEHASVMMLDYVKMGLDEGAWNEATVNAKPLVIYDLNGKKLFYQYSIQKNGKNVGEIKITASKVLGNILQEIGEPYSYDPTVINDKVDNLVERKFPGYSVKSIQYVSYDYPNIGVKIKLSDEKTNDQKDFMFDAVTFSTITDANMDQHLVTDGWSFYGQIPEKEFAENAARWKTNDEYVTNLKTIASTSGINVSQPIQENQVRLMNQATLSPNAVGEANYIQNFPTTTQAQSKWCMIGTAWLITKFYYPSGTRTQTNIANSMGVYGDTAPSATAEIYYYMDYYRNGAASGGLEKRNSISSWTTPNAPPISYDLIKEEIDANRPMKTGVNLQVNGNIYSHARACIGYWQYTDGSRLYKYSDPASGILTWISAPGSGGSDLQFIDYVIVK